MKSLNMITVLLPQGGYPTTVKYIISYVGGICVYQTVVRKIYSVTYILIDSITNTASSIHPLFFIYVRR